MRDYQRSHIKTYRDLRMRNNKGFTLVELIMVMAVFIVVIIAISYTFENIVRRSSQQAKSATSQIEGIVGLEMLRTDISHAGFGLPWTLGVPRAAFPEVANTPVTGLGIDGTTFANFKDSAPRSVVAGAMSSGSFNGSYYLVLKSALLALNTSSNGRFGFVNYSAGNKSYVHTVNDATNTDIRPAQDQIINILSSFSTTGAQTKQLLMKDNSATGFYYQLPANSFSLATVDNAYKPTDASQVILAYAISDGSALRMPYNRADYYINRDNATISPSCNPNTGVLYKAVAGQQSGSDYAGIYPLLNCVGDMQVVFGLDRPVGSGTVGYWDPKIAAITALSATDLVDQLKEVRVYILAHEGKKDANYTYPGATIAVGEFGLGRTWTATELATAFGTDWKNYRWKVYSIVVQMKNLGGA